MSLQFKNLMINRQVGLLGKLEQDFFLIIKYGIKVKNHNKQKE